MIAAVVRPFRLALFEGEADPPPARSRVHVGTLQVLDLVLAVILYAVVATHSSADANDTLTNMIAIAIALPIVLRGRWPLGAWRTSLALLPLIAMAAGLGSSASFALWPAAIMYGLVMYAVGVRCDRRVTIAAGAVTMVGILAAAPSSALIGATVVAVAGLFSHGVRAIREETPIPAPSQPVLWTWPGKLKRRLAAAILPFRLALFEGDADPPPPRGRWLRVPLPSWAPARSFDLVQALDLVAMWVLFGTTLSEALIWNEGPPFQLPFRLPLGLVYFAAAAVSLPLGLRNRWPLAAWRTALVMTPLALYVLGKLGGGPYIAQMSIMYLLVTYAAAVRSDRKITIAIWFITFAVTWIVDPNSMPITMVVVSIALLFGYNVRARRLAAARLSEEELKTHQAEEAQAVLEERARIARELHDIVAHHMSVIAIHAEAVPLKAAGDPAQLEAGLAEIRGLSLDAIAQLRQVLGVLRDEEGRVDTAPQPGLDRIEELVANARATGLKVRVEQPDSDGVPPAVGLSAYRIVQESLSNAMRHAPGATVTVRIAREQGEIRLSVANGPGTRPGGPAGAGQGVVGMRERAVLLGGTLEAAPRRDGGFEVLAVLPVADEMEDK
ncbi:sensor histidine kinase [Nonomuraea sediminis]|uniref:sensor histidine kinase n=1 Tax=Nonomuraea sediminis TaxID=2835864 RepID=UPI001BDCF526|nr:histidine kinase [Nonomuraea sediminis]